MAISRVQYKTGQGSGGDIDVTFDSSVTAGSLLLCCASSYLQSTPYSLTIADDQSNSWTEIYDTNYDGHDVGLLAYVMNANSGSTTVTVTGNGNSWYTVVLIEVSDILTASALDQNNSADTAGSSWDSGDITTTQNDEYIIGMLAHDNGDQALTEDAAFTLIFEEETGSANMPISVGERIVSSTLTESYSGTIAASSEYFAGIASFKMAAAAGRTTKNTDASPLGIHTGISWRINVP